MIKIGILYIGIGRYACFWPEFYNSCELNLVPEAEKHYYIFTDQATITPSDRIEVFHQDDMGWPCNSLLRFKMFCRIKDRLSTNDYLFFFNANAQVVSPVTAQDILPADEDFSALCIETNPERCRMNTALSQQPVYRLGVPNTTIPVPSMVERHSLTSHC